MIQFLKPEEGYHYSKTNLCQWDYSRISDLIYSSSHLPPTGGSLETCQFHSLLPPNVDRLRHVSSFPYFTKFDPRWIIRLTCLGPLPNPLVPHRLFPQPSWECRHIGHLPRPGVVPPPSDPFLLNPTKIEGFTCTGRPSTYTYRPRDSSPDSISVFGPSFSLRPSVFLVLCPYLCVSSLGVSVLGVCVFSLPRPVFLRVCPFQSTCLCLKVLR